jgi:hypothetical protein
VLHAGDALADLLALHVLDVAEHALLAEVLAGEVVGAERRGVVGRQGDEVVEDAGPREASRWKVRMRSSASRPSAVSSYSELISLARS